MTLAGYEFDYVCDIEPVRSADGSVRQFSPDARYKNTAILPLNRYGAGPFCKFKIPPRLRLPGVYLLMVANYVRYVGECVNLSSRFNAGYGNISPRNCFKGGQETNCRLNTLIFRTVLDGQVVSLSFHVTKNHKAIESILRSALRPVWNSV